MAASKRWAATTASMPEKFGITLVRIVVGAVFLMHGYQKWFVYGHAGVETSFVSMGIPYASLSAYAAMTAELLCGALLVVGFLTRLAAIPIVVVMTVAILKVHLAHGFYIGFNPVNPGYEFALTLGITALGLIFTGPGILAVDNLLA